MCQCHVCVDGCTDLDYESTSKHIPATRCACDFAWMSCDYCFLLKRHFLHSPVYALKCPRCLGQNTLCSRSGRRHTCNLVHFEKLR